MTETPPGNLFTRLLGVIEGEYQESRVLSHTGGAIKTIQVSVCGADLWSQTAREHRTVTVLQFLGIVHFVLSSSFWNRAREERAADQWYVALAAAINRGDIKTRDRDSWLPISPEAADFRSLISLGDADSFVRSMGMDWTCTEAVEHLAKEAENSESRHIQAAGGGMLIPPSPSRDEAQAGLYTIDSAADRLQGEGGAEQATEGAPPADAGLSNGAKLTVEQRVEIVRRAAEGETQTALAKEFGVSRTAIGKVLEKSKENDRRSGSAFRWPK